MNSDYSVSSNTPTKVPIRGSGKKQLYSFTIIDDKLNGHDEISPGDTGFIRIFSDF